MDFKILRIMAMKFTKILLIILSVYVSSANAVSVTLNGDNFDVTYDDALLGLYGTPQISNNVLFFTPTNFSSTSQNGEGISITNSTINLTLQPKNGYGFSSFNYEERGDYLLLGNETTVRLAGQIRVRHVDDVLAESNGFFEPFESLQEQGNHNWSATSFIDGATGDWVPGESAVILTIENILLASTESLGELAFIEKKFVAAEIELVPVPLPGTFVLLLSSILSLGAGSTLAKRRKHSVS